MGILWEQKNATVMADLCTNILSVSVKKKIILIMIKMLIKMAKDNASNYKYSVNKKGKR